MKIILVRHTQTICPGGTCYGRLDVDLLPSFDEDKKNVIRQLKDVHFDLVYSSPLTRCTQLADAICQLTGKPVVTDKRLVELDFGQWEGKTWDEISQTPEAKLWFSDFLNVACPRGESYRELLHRVQNFLADLATHHPNEIILIVTHAGVIRAIHSILSHSKPMEAFSIKIGFGEVISDLPEVVFREINSYRITD